MTQAVVCFLVLATDRYQMRLRRYVPYGARPCRASLDPHGRLPRLAHGRGADPVLIFPLLVTAFAVFALGAAALFALRRGRV